MSHEEGHNLLPMVSIHPILDSHRNNGYDLGHMGDVPILLDTRMASYHRELHRYFALLDNDEHTNSEET